MAKQVMRVYDLYWAPEGRKIATVTASTMKAAKRKAPMPYRKYLGEIGAEDRGVAEKKNPKKSVGLIPAFVDAQGRVFVNAKHVKQNPRPMGVPEKHMLKIARQTLKYSDIGAFIMGGMTKERARQVIREYGGGEREIRKLEGEPERNPRSIVMRKERKRK